MKRIFQGQFNTKCLQNLQQDLECTSFNCFHTHATQTRALNRSLRSAEYFIQEKKTYEQISYLLNIGTAPTDLTIEQ